MSLNRRLNGPKQQKYLQSVYQLRRVEPLGASVRVVVPAAMVDRTVTRRVRDEDAHPDGALPRQLGSTLQPSGNVLRHIQPCDRPSTSTGIETGGHEARGAGLPSPTGIDVLVL